MPLALPSWTQAHGVGEVERFPRETDALAACLAEDHAQIDRGADYLNWRYSEHPFARYVLLVRRSATGMDGVAVMRIASALGREVTLVMELLATSSDAERVLGSAR